MKKIVLLWFIGVSINYCNAQQNLKDSIKHLLENDKEDTNRVLHLAILSSYNLESKPDTAIILSLEALSLSRNIGFLKGEATSLTRLGNGYGVIGNHLKAMELYLQALKINEKINNADGIQKNLNNIGLVYFDRGDYRQALEYLFKAKILAENIQNKTSVAIVLGAIGQSYFQLKIFDSARLYAQQSYDIANQINYYRAIGYSFSNMGDIHFETGQNNLALEYYRLSIPYSKKAENDLRISYAYSGMAKVFQATGQNDSAFFFAKQSVAMAREKGFTNVLLNASGFLYSLYKKSGNRDSALFYLELAKTADDSLFNKQKQGQLQSLFFDEKLRQQEIAAAELKAKQERKNKLQYAGIAIGLIVFLTLFLMLSRSIIVQEKFIKFFGVLGLLSVFEFINLFIHPYLAHATNDSPVLMLVVLIAIAALLIPLHHKLEKWLTKIMVEKNKKIRLAAAKKTIEKLEKPATL